MKKKTSDHAPKDVPGGEYIVLNGKWLELERHPTDFSVLAVPASLPSKVKDKAQDVWRLSAQVTRVKARNQAGRDAAMKQVRQARVAHHIYRLRRTGEEIVIDDHLFLTLRQEDPDLAAAIAQEFSLDPEGRMGDAYILRLTGKTGGNPLKTANQIAARDGVSDCSPQVLIPLQRTQLSFVNTHPLFRQQWHLGAGLMTSFELHPTANVRATEAWQLTIGSPEIVVAVIDDGFDLGHPSFADKLPHPAMHDFAGQDSDVAPELGGNHGTCVASIAVGSSHGTGVIGVAPGCSFLPIRIDPLGVAFTAISDLLNVFRHVSTHADVVNCSFGLATRTFDLVHDGFKQELSEMARNGGRRGKGLVIVFSAGNDNAPLILPRVENLNGVSLPEGGQIDAHEDIFSGPPRAESVIIVGATTSLNRKADYSNWGQHLTVVAPSDNFRNLGLGLIAAVNRPNVGSALDILPDDPATPDFREDFYTAKFGGTSGAAPIVAGVAALMLSVNPNLTAQQVKEILEETADKNLVVPSQQEADPNWQGKNGEFIDGHSLFFGAGKVDARRAVERAATT